MLAQRYDVRSGTVYVLITKDNNATARVRSAAEEASRLLPGGRVDDVERLPSGAAASFVTSKLAGDRAADRIGLLRQRLGPDVFVTGDAAIQHDLAPVLTHDLKVGELYLAVPAALVILLLVFGTGSALLPFLFAAATIPPALGIAWGAAHLLELSDYLRNMVLMIGLGIAIDYSLLVVNRYRDERRRGLEHRGRGGGDDAARRPDDPVQRARRVGRPGADAAAARSVPARLRRRRPRHPRRLHGLRADAAAGDADDLRRAAGEPADHAARPGRAPPRGRDPAVDRRTPAG